MGEKEIHVKVSPAFGDYGCNGFQQLLLEQTTIKSNQRQNHLFIVLLLH